MSFATCMQRIATLDSLIASVDPGWQSAMSGSSLASGVQALNSASPFAGVLESVSSPAPATASTSTSATSSPVLSEADRQPAPDTVLGPSYGTPGDLVQESTKDALARFDSVSSNIPYALQVREAALANGIDPLLLTSLCWTESSFKPNAVSHCGAQGLTQLMPRTAASLGVTDSFDVSQNLNGGAKYLATQMRSFGRVDLALAAYNQGPGTVAAAGGVPNGTWSYVNGILTTWQRYEGQTR
jgi:soluble lytic murein transglycosylase-like protein